MVASSTTCRRRHARGMNSRRRRRKLEPVNRSISIAWVFACRRFSCRRGSQRPHRQRRLRARVDSRDRDEMVAAGVSEHRAVASRAGCPHLSRFLDAANHADRRSRLSIAGERDGHDQSSEDTCKRLQPESSSERAHPGVCRRISTAVEGKGRDAQARTSGDGRRGCGSHSTAHARATRHALGTGFKGGADHGAAGERHADEGPVAQAHGAQTISTS